MKQYTILVNSCDAYEDLWLPFFKLLKRYWPNVEKHDIVLNTETKSFEFEGMDIIKPKLSEEDCVTWAKRFKTCLEQIETKYVLVLLDDFFLEDTVDENRINNLIDAMDMDPNIKNFSLVPTLWANIDDNAFQGFELRPRRAPYLLNMQAGLWRTEELKELVREHESPWEFEEYGTFRAYRKGGKYYVAKHGYPQIFTYNWKPGGAVHRGKWTEGVDKILAEIGVEIDYSKRGWDADVQEELKHRTLRQKISDFISPYLKVIVFYTNWKSLF